MVSASAATDRNIVILSTIPTFNEARPNQGVYWSLWRQASLHLLAEPLCLDIQRHYDPAQFAHLDTASTVNRPHSPYPR